MIQRFPLLLGSLVKHVSLIYHVCDRGTPSFEFFENFRDIITVSFRQGESFEHILALFTNYVQKCATLTAPSLLIFTAISYYVQSLLNCFQLSPQRVLSSRHRGSGGFANGCEAMLNRKIFNVTLKRLSLKHNKLLIPCFGAQTINQFILTIT